MQRQNPAAALGARAHLMISFGSRNESKQKFDLCHAHIGIGGIFPHRLDSVFEQVVVGAVFHLVWLFNPIEISCELFDLCLREGQLMS